MQGQDVRDWQALLSGLGFAVTVDGIYGPKTRDATASWQASVGLPATGVVTALDLERARAKAPPSPYVIPPKTTSTPAVAPSARAPAGSEAMLLLAGALAALAVYHLLKG
mgnify:CR=1 FL=1